MERKGEMSIFLQELGFMPFRGLIFTGMYILVEIDEEA